MHSELPSIRNINLQWNTLWQSLAARRNSWNWAQCCLLNTAIRMRPRQTNRYKGGKETRKTAILFCFVLFLAIFNHRVTPSSPEKTTVFFLKPSYLTLRPPSPAPKQLAHTDTFTANHNSLGEQQNVYPSLKTKTFRQMQTYYIGKAIWNMKSLAFIVLVQE